jgi:hypothetical protein
MKRYLHGVMFLLSLGLIPAFAQEQPMSIAVEKMPDQPLPVTVQVGRLESFQYTSQLFAQISSVKGVDVVSAEFLLIVYRDGKAIAGEGWLEDSPSGSIMRYTRLAINPGDHALLIVKAASTSYRTLRLNEEDLGGQIHEFIEGHRSHPVAVEISLLAQRTAKVIRVQTGNSYCDGALAGAVHVCGEGQVASFSCDASKSSYSFSCKGAKVVPVTP